jgi:V-type H+-transporting ATPase subunit F
MQITKPQLRIYSWVYIASVNVKLLFQVVDKETETKDIEASLKTFLARSDVGIVMITQCHAEKVRHLIDAHVEPIPTILEIPSKDNPYDAEKDSVLKRAR